MTTTPPRFNSGDVLLQLQDRGAFERALPRILLSGAGAALLLGLLPFPFYWPLVLLVPTVLSVTAFVGDRLDRVLLSAPALALPAFRWLPASTTWQLALAGASVGVLWIQAERCRLRFEAPLAPRLPGPWHFLTSAAATAGLTVWGVHVSTRIADIMVSGGAPVLFASASAGATFALFVSLGRLVAHVGREEDPLIARIRLLLTELPPDADDLLRRSLRAHEAAQAVLNDMRDAATREAWAHSLRRAMEGLVERAAELGGLPRPDGAASRRQRLEREALAHRLERTDDPLTRAQLAEALKAMEHEARGRDAIRLARERTLAQLHAGTALMEQGQLALQRTRHALAVDRAEALASASRHLRALSTLDPVGEAPPKEAPDDAPAPERVVAPATGEWTPASAPPPRVEV